MLIFSVSRNKYIDFSAVRYIFQNYRGANLYITFIGLLFYRIIFIDKQIITSIDSSAHLLYTFSSSNSVVHCLKDTSMLFFYLYLTISHLFWSTPTI